MSEDGERGEVEWVMCETTTGRVLDRWTEPAPTEEGSMSPEEVVADALANPPIGGDPRLLVPSPKYRVRPEVEARFILGMLRAEGYEIVRRAESTEEGQQQ